MLDIWVLDDHSPVNRLSAMCPWRLLTPPFSHSVHQVPPVCVYVSLGPAIAVSLMGGWSRSAVLELYRALLRAGRHLQYTDRNYYRRAVAREFRRCQALSAPQDKEDALKRGQFFLSSRLGGLV